MSGDPEVPARTVRPYRSPLRELQAEETRTRVCRAAAPLFADHGYTSTSVRQVAAAAGVSVETVYAVGGKAVVFLRSFELAFSGTTEGASLLDLDPLAPVWAAPTLEDLVHGMTGFIVASNERSAGLWTAYVEGANSDDVLAAAYARRMDAMRADGRRVLDLAVRRSLCAAPEDPDRTVDAVWVLLHPSQYVLLVSHAGWDRAAYHSWMHQAVLGVLRA